MWPIPDSPDVEARVYRECALPREQVWEWMLTHPCELLAMESFHERVEPPELPLRKGTRILIHHALPFGYRESRHARVNALRPFVLGFGEVADRGHDFFPHSYRFSLAALDDTHTVVGFHIRGRFQIPGARFWWVPWWRSVAQDRIGGWLRDLEEAVRRDAASG